MASQACWTVWPARRAVQKRTIRLWLWFSCVGKENLNRFRKVMNHDWRIRNFMPARVPNSLIPGKLFSHRGNLMPRRGFSFIRHHQVQQLFGVTVPLCFHFLLHLAENLPALASETSIE